ncbi:glycosyltransferase family 4 protein [Candidatus Uhrbacteria bacterium]|nr:glycosyltransferase family 4 protein [Candidatus Uhrbacteria bacterium]
MKLAMVTPVLGSAGGLGRVAEEQAKRLAERGHEVTLFFPSKNPSPLLNRSIAQSFSAVPVIPRFRYGHGAWLPQLSSLLEPFPLAHLHYPFLGGAGAVARWRRKTRPGKLVVTYHMDLLGSGLLRPVFRGYQRWMMPRAVCAADRLIVSSRDYAEQGDLRRLLPRINDRLSEIPFGVDEKKFQPGQRDQNLLDKLGLGENEKVILFVGGLDRAHYFKGVPVLLAAFQEFLKTVGTARLLLVGSGDRLTYFEHLVAESGIASRVSFASAVSSEELPAYYRLADVLVLPSLDRSEAFGLVLLEAQASGVPVVSSNLPGVRTVLEDKKTGLLVPPGDAAGLTDALRWLFNHPEERGVMGQAARERILAKYRWDTVIDHLETIYQSIF